MADSSQQPVITLVTSPAELGKAIRVARGAMGLSLREAAERAGVGKRFALELEQGKSSARLDKVLALVPAGESTEVQTPGGVKRYEILDVRYE